MNFGITQAKSVFTSKTFWAALLALLATISPKIMPYLGITPTNQAIVIANIVAFFGFIGTVYGRMAATQPVTLTGGQVIVALDSSQKNPPVIPIVPAIPIAAIPIEVPKQPGTVVQAGHLEIITRFVPNSPSFPAAPFVNVAPEKWADVSGEIPKK